MNIFGYSFFDRQIEPKQEERSETSTQVVDSNFFSSYGSKVDRLSVVYGCMRIRSSAVSQLPISVFKRNEDGSTEEADDHNLYKLLRNPNSFQTTPQLLTWIVTQLDLYGNAYLQKVRNGFGDVVEILPLSSVNAVIDFNDTTGVVSYRLNEKFFSNDQIIHFKEYSHNGLEGESKIKQFKDMFDRYATYETSGTQMTKNAAKPSGIMYYKGVNNNEELDNTRNSWHSGFKNEFSGKTAFLPEGKYTFKPYETGLTAADQQYIENIKFTAQRIASDIYGIPPHMLNLSSSPTYASVEAAQIDFLTNTISPILKNIEKVFEKAFDLDGDDLFVRFNTNDLLRGDTTSRINYLKFMHDNGIMTANQISIREGLGNIIPDSKGGNDYLRPVNVARIDNNAVSGSVVATGSNDIKSAVDASET